MLDASLDNNGKGPPRSLSGRRIGDGGAVFLGPLHGLLDVFHREVRPQARVFVRGQGLPDAHLSSVCARRHTGLPEIGVGGTKGQAVKALIEPRQGVYVVADDLQVVNGHLRILLYLAVRHPTFTIPGTAPLVRSRVGPYGHAATVLPSRSSYLLVDVGWKGYERAHGALVHVDVIDGKFWIHYDGTEEGIATQLVAEGVPPDRIVLAFKHPTLRKRTGFAAA